MGIREVMTGDQQSIYQSMLAKAKRGEISEGDIGRIIDSGIPNFRAQDLLRINRTVDFRNQYVNQFVTPIFERVPEELRENFENARIVPDAQYRVIEANCYDYAGLRPTAARALDRNRPLFGENTILPWKCGESESTFRFFVDENFPDTYLLLKVPTPTDNGPVNAIRAAYTYFFDKTTS